MPGTPAAGSGPPRRGASLDTSTVKISSIRHGANRQRRGLPGPSARRWRTSITACAVPETPRPGRPSASSPARGSREMVALRCEDEIALGQSIDLVGPDLHDDLPPREVKIRMMALLLGHRAYAIDERKRRLEVRELEGLGQMMIPRRLPAFDLREQVRDLVGRQGRHPTPARHTVLFVKFHRRLQGLVAHRWICLTGAPRLCRAVKVRRSTGMTFTRPSRPPPPAPLAPAAPARRLARGRLRRRPSRG